MNEKISFDIKLTKENKEVIEELLKTKEVYHYLLDIYGKEKLDLVEYKDYKKLEKENQQLKEQLKQKEALIKKIENIFDDPNNSFSDGCDCRKIEKLLDNKGE